MLLKPNRLHQPGILNFSTYLGLFRIMCGILMVMFLKAGLILSSTAASDTLPSDVYTSMVADLYWHYRRCPIFVIYSTTEGSLSTLPFEETKLLVKFKKDMPFVPMATLALTSIDVRNSHGELYVVLNFSDLVCQQLRKRVHSSHSRWLLFSDDMGNPEHVLQTVNIPFDCELLVAQYSKNRPQHILLREVYRSNEISPMRSFLWGSWSPDDGFQIPKLPLHLRRNDFFGTQLKAVAISNPPDVIFDKGIINGFAITIFSILEKKLNFSLKVILPTEEEYGKLMENGSWTGVLGCLQRGEADVSLNTMVPTKERQEVVAFSQTVFLRRDYAYIQQPEKIDWSWTTYLTPFSYPLWITILVTIIGVSSVTYLAHQLWSCYGARTEDILSLSSFGDILHTVGGIFCMQAPWLVPYSWSGRLIRWTSFLTALILFNSYSANLIADLTANTLLVLPFTSFEGLLQDGTYEFSVMKGTTYINYFKDTTDPILYQIYLKYLKPRLNSLPSSVQEGLSRVCRRKDVFMCGEHMVDSLQSGLSCSVMALPGAGHFVNILSFVLRKDSPFNSIILHSLEEMRNSGILLKIMKQFEPKTFNTFQRQFYGISLGQVAPLLFVLLCATILAIVIVVVQNVFQSYVRKQRYKVEN